MTPVLDVDITHKLGAFRLAARFSSDAGVTALFGRSGSGKTTLVNIIAGLLRPDAGRILLNGQALIDTAAGVNLPTHQRRIGYVFQDARLFPHLRVRQNLIFGRWFGKCDASEGPSLDEVAELLGLTPLLDRKPEALSGGEKQRVAIGRALLAHPRLLLMDEPLAALDEARKREILPYIERLRDHARLPIIYVSHSVTEVARLATTMVVLDEGAVQAHGPIDTLMRRSELVTRAGLAEPSTVLDAEVIGEEPPFGLTTLKTGAGLLQITHSGALERQKLRIRILSSDILVALAHPENTSALNSLPGRIRTLSESSVKGIIDLEIDCANTILVARIAAKSAERLCLAPDLPVHAIIKSVAIE